MCMYLCALVWPSALHGGGLCMYMHMRVYLCWYVCEGGWQRGQLNYIKSTVQEGGS